MEMANRLKLEISPTGMAEFLDSHAQELADADFWKLTKWLRSVESRYDPFTSVFTIRRFRGRIRILIRIFARQCILILKTVLFNPTIIKNSYVCTRETFSEMMRTSNQTSLDS
jgi:hypothetical protein